jgi:2-hydroxy-3-keto-5-methylthiopentenyl-1-phosphate phosphatase
LWSNPQPYYFYMAPTTRAIYVTDFDGTLARQDFYQLVIARLLPPTVPNYWQDYLDHKLTHFEVLRQYFALIKGSQAEMESVLNAMELDPALPGCLHKLRAAGWEVVVASAGCAWYIERLLAALTDPITVHANPGRWVPGEGLRMQLPHGSPFFSPSNGIDKAALVKAAMGQVGKYRVAYAGDGLTDVIPALLVHEKLRFARGDLARILTKKKQSYHQFEWWSETVERLLQIPVL